MPEATIPVDKALYESVKKEADKKFDKPSAYKSGWIVKTYKELGGKYSGEKPKDGLTRWFKEDWKDIAGLYYPVFRPTKKISKKTPLTVSEIDKQNLIEQSILKQSLKGDYNLPPFIKR